MGLVSEDLPYGAGERRYIPNLVLPVNMIGLVQTRYGERLHRGVEPLVQKAFKILRLLRIGRPYNHDVGTGRFDAVRDQAADRRETCRLAVGFVPGNEMQVGKDDPDVRTRRDFVRFGGKPNRQACHFQPVQASRQSGEVLLVVVDDDHARCRHDHFFSPNTKATVDPSKPSGISTSPGWGKTSCPPFKSIARFV